MIKRSAIVIVSLLICIYNIINQNVMHKYNTNLLSYIKSSQPLTDEEKSWLKENHVITYGADNNAPPLRYKDPKTNQYKGIFVDYLNMLSLEIGAQIDVKPLVWEEALRQLKIGETDICDMFISNERARDYLFTNPIYNLRGVMVVRHDNNSVINYNNLNNKKIALQLGDYSNEFSKNNINNGRYIYVENLSDALRLLDQKKVDAVIGDEPVCSYIISQNNFHDTLKIVEKPVYQEDVVLAVPKTHRTLVNILNKGIHSLNSRKAVEQMQQKWFGISSPITETGDMDRIIVVSIMSICCAAFLIIYIFYIWNRSLQRAVKLKTRELENSKKQLQSTFDVFSTFMFVVNDEGTILNVNESLCKYLSLKKDEIVGESINNLSDMFSKMWMYINNSRKQEGERFEFKYQSKIYEIKVKSIENNKSSEEDKSLEFKYILITANDVTKLRIAERQLLQSDKMSAIGQLAAGVAHEIRNPLGIIRNYCYVLKTQNKIEDEVFTKSVSSIEVSVERANDIIDNLLNFSRISGDKYSYIYIRDFFKNLLKLEGKAISKQNIETCLESDDIIIYTNEDCLKHIFINLISNSMDAMELGGTIKIICSLNDNNLNIVFSDTGGGIEKENIDKIFNPFFTTKSPGKGTGLGLFIVYNEIQKLGGRIKIESEKNKGTIFDIEIPIKEEL